MPDRAQHEGLPSLRSGSGSLLVGLPWVTPLLGQALRVKLIDPFSHALTSASMAVADQEMPTDDSGAAILADPAGGPELVVVRARNSATASRGVAGSERSVTIQWVKSSRTSGS